MMLRGREKAIRLTCHRTPACYFFYVFAFVCVKNDISTVCQIKIHVNSFL